MELLSTKLSMRRNGVLFLCLIVCISLLFGCAQGGSYSSRYGYYTGVKNPRPQKDDQKQTSSESQPKGSRSSNRNTTYHYVTKGDTLYSIAWEYGYDAREIARWNRIRWPYTIYPKQKLRITPATKHKKTAKSSSTKGYKSTSKVTKKAPSSASKQSTRSKQKWSKVSWQWPTNGKVIGTFSARESGKKGLDIAGKKGQPVYSASGGQVVYSGSGLRGYGKLIIIKHNDTFFSAYAHNHRLYVKEKQKVKKGQHIADMGSSEAQRVMLHFEVRRNGKPVDPKKYLPRRR